MTNLDWLPFARALFAHLKARGILTHWKAFILFGDKLIIGRAFVPVPKACNDN